jgi:hypothetical protein
LGSPSSRDRGLAAPYEAVVATDRDEAKAISIAFLAYAGAAMEAGLHGVPLAGVDDLFRAAIIHSSASPRR